MNVYRVASFVAILASATPAMAQDKPRDCNPTGYHATQPREISVDVVKSLIDYAEKYKITTVFIGGSLECHNNKGHQRPGIYLFDDSGLSRVVVGAD
jgi:hypothetical protein